MRASPTQHRQIAYCLGILLLFVLMLPYTIWLRRLKDQKELGEATIGQVDAGGFLLKLALLGGARGVAANVLWNRAIDLQKVHDWDRLKVTVDQITKLQPHFLRVWSWQGWNLAYNVSVEWDAPEDKYEWIKQGINFLKDGVRHNQQSPDLRWDTGWTFFQKIGVADEAIILRRLLRDDDDLEFAADPSTGRRQPQPDNFLVAHGWFQDSVNLVDRGQNRLAYFSVDAEKGDDGKPKARAIQAPAMEAPVEYVDRVESRKGHPGDLHFRSMPASSLTRYAAALEKASTLNVPPTFGERARQEWARAKDAWQAFGDYPFPAHNDRELMVYLDDAIRESMAPGRLGWRRARKDPKTANQWYWTDRWADNTHYRYWKDRALAEMDPRGVAARRLFHEGILALKAAEFPKAVEAYREGLATWDALLKEHPTYRGDDLSRLDTGQVVRRYQRALVNAGLEPPKDMPFRDLIKGREDYSMPDPFSQDDMPVANPGEDPLSGGRAQPK